MSVTQDIVATYRGPARVVSRLAGQGRQEVRALTFVLLAGLVIFVAQAPYQAREAHFSTDVPLEARLYWSAFLWIFLFPFLLYVVAALLWGVTRVLRPQISGYAIRLSLFWAFLASSPVILLCGLVAAFIGPGAPLQLCGILWLCLFLWFWLSGLVSAERQAV